MTMTDFKKTQEVMTATNGAAPAPVVEEPTAPLVQPKPIEQAKTGRPRVVIVGAGFGGLSAAKELAGSDVEVLLVDRNNYHGFWPLLYQVATAGIESESIAYPVRAIIRKYENVNFRMADVKSVDWERKQVITDGAPIPYDYLILAAGSTNNYFGNQSLAQNTYGMKDVDDAERLRNHVLTQFERAASETDADKRRALMTLVIIGGGPTGVELAGAFAELIRHVIRKDFPRLDLSEARVILVEAVDDILTMFPERLRRNARKRLEDMGVQVRLKSPVDNVSEHTISFKDGTTLLANTVVWAAGVRGATLTDNLGLKTVRGARIQIEPTLQVPDHPNVFGIGDVAYLEDYPGGKAYAQVAPVAVQQGELAAKNILAHLAGKPLRAFKYFNKGQMATIGRRAAVLDAFGIQLTGRIAWLGWLFVHIMELVGFRNRVIVLTNWAVNYFTYDRGVRLITRNE